MSGSWSLFQPPSSLGEFECDTMLLLTDGSVLIHNAYQGLTANWSRLTPDDKGNYLPVAGHRRCRWPIADCTSPLAY